MPKALCMSGMAVAILLTLLFLGDLLASLGGVNFPFGGVSKTMDIAMIVCALILGYASWYSFKHDG